MSEKLAIFIYRIKVSAFGSYHWRSPQLFGWHVDDWEILYAMRTFPSVKAYFIEAWTDDGCGDD